jgi:hypothetical protein
MIIVLVEKLLDVARNHGAAHVRDGLLHALFHVSFLTFIRRFMRNTSENLCAPFRTHFNHKEVLTPIVELGKGQIKSPVCSWAGSHRCTETGSARLRTIDRDNEEIFSTTSIGGINNGALQKYLVEDFNGV